MKRARPAFAILVGGLVGGAFDLTYAIVFSAMHGVAPQRILQSVASGLLGSASFTGGVPTAVLGFVLHFCIALAAAAVFYLASLRLPFLTRRPIVSGAVFGFCVYWIMNLVVLPLSAFPGQWKFNAVLLTADLIVHMFLFGVSIALATRRAHRM